MCVCERERERELPCLTVNALLPIRYVCGCAHPVERYPNLTRSFYIYVYVYVCVRERERERVTLSNGQLVGTCAVARGLTLV